MRLGAAAVAAALVLLVGSGAAPVGRAAIKQPQPAVLLAVGDIGTCRSAKDEAVAAMVGATPGSVAALGDIAYPDGTADQFARCFDPAWAPLKSRIWPTPGNHDYHTRDAGPYFAYFGRRAGKPGRGFYAYRLGSWRIIVLNSNCGHVGCKQGSEQDRWLRVELRRHPSRCTLAYWHHPRFRGVGQRANLDAIWQELYRAGAEVVLNGHLHNYHRFAPQRPDGRLDRRHGIRQFIVGTGGAGLTYADRRTRNIEVLDDSTFGVLRLVLGARSYSWQFLPIPGQAFSDAGSGTCDGRP